MGIIKLKGIILEPFSGNIKNIHEMHRYENGELVASTFFENSRRTRKLDFRDDERFETIYEYHQNYDAEIIYDYDQNNVEYFVSVKNPFDEYKKFDIYSADKNFLEQKIKKEGDWQQFLILKTDESEISYTFNGEKLTEMIFEIKGYEESYRINVAYSEDGKTCQVWKKYVNAEYPTIMKTYEFADNMVIEREDNQIKYTVSDERERVVRIGQFSYNEEKLNLFRCYMQTQDEETFSEIMKDIRLETFNYDEFENLILHEVSFYRPDFSKDRLTPYLEEIEHFDQYNIHYGSEYCKTKEDYDDYSGTLHKLEYLEGKVNEYNQEDELVAVYYIENGKKTHAEFFSPDYFSIKKYDEYGNVIELYTEHKATNFTKTTTLKILYQ